ncbi:hypothetical protein [Actinomadura rupiterrae]|uniref:hypothetical protein n=1 Tax=Actinomadura rupiterrae TaxID=559627 RepID=UPI0020A3F372|nr:hypothetical protein [Actinomadura rupiterrae]MCP2336221.1 hypothetical protein [Actinomadura rupiterrae]
MPFVVVLVSLAGCAAMPSAEEQAASVARDKARRAGNVLRGGPQVRAQDIAHRASELDGTEVMNVSGTSLRDKGGVRLVVRLEGQSTEAFGGNEIRVKRCFELRVDQETPFDTAPPQVRCPASAPLRFGPWPKGPRLPSETSLRKAIPAVPPRGRADEGTIRQAVERMRLDPAISVRYLTEDDTVGVSLTVRPSAPNGPLDCVLVSVAPGKTDVFVPSTVQRMPGEAGCEPGNAVHPMPPPH